MARGDLRLLFLGVPERKAVKNRVHLDVHPTGCDQEEEVERLLGLGATRVDIGQGRCPGWCSPTLSLDMAWAATCWRPVRDSTRCT
jgi:glyoxalase superfamily protein